MLVDRRTGRRSSELNGPAAPSNPKPPPPAWTPAPGCAWRFHDWAWDARRMTWVLEMHHVYYPLTVRDLDDGRVAGTTNGRHWRTAVTPAELLELFFPIDGED